MSTQPDSSAIFRMIQSATSLSEEVKKELVGMLNAGQVEQAVTRLTKIQENDKQEFSALEDEVARIQAEVEGRSSTEDKA